MSATVPLSAPTMPLANSYPVHLVLQDQPVLVVGGGNVAIRKVEGLLASGAAVTVVAPEVRDEIRLLPVARILERAYQRGEVASYRLAITCTDDSAVNAQVFRDAEAAGVWANSADDPGNCGFILPSVARQGDLAVTVSTAGKSPALASWMRRRLEAELDDRYTKLLDVLAEVRAEARAHFGTSEIRGWNAALDDGLFELVADGDTEGARTKLRSHLGLPTQLAGGAGRVDK